MIYFFAKYSGNLLLHRHSHAFYQNWSYGKTTNRWLILVQERRNSIANALELCFSCTNPSKSEINSQCIHSPQVQKICSQTQ